MRYILRGFWSLLSILRIMTIFCQFIFPSFKLAADFNSISGKAGSLGPIFPKVCSRTLTNCLSVINPIGTVLGMAFLE